MLKKQQFEDLLLITLSTLTMTFIMILINFGFSHPDFFKKWATTWVICFPIVILVSTIAKLISIKISSLIYK